MHIRIYECHDSCSVVCEIFVNISRKLSRFLNLRKYFYNAYKDTLVHDVKIEGNLNKIEGKPNKIEGD